MAAMTPARPHAPQHEVTETLLDPYMSPSSAATSESIHPIVGDRIIEGDGTSAATWRAWHGLQTLAPMQLGDRLAPKQRVCIFAPHPDDEIIGCGGLLQQLAERDHPLLIVHVTNGSQSHPNSTRYPPEALECIRPQESLHALEVLGIQDRVTLISLEMMDGEVYAQQDLLRQKLTAFVTADDVLVTPFVHDGHPDHEATGQVVAAFAKRYGLPCWQVLIWAWHWAHPDDPRIPWAQAHKLDLTPKQLALKMQAIDCFESQITTDTSTGNAPILSATTLTRTNQPWEVYLYD